MDNRYLADSHDHHPDEPSSSLTIAHFFRILGNYRKVIALAVLTVAVGYTILANTLYLLAPAVRLTSLDFRLEFAGAEQGLYPNGVKFSSAEVISTPILLKTFRDNRLEQFMSLSDFVGAIFVVESNAEREALASEYQARLADNRLTSVDRERIQREYEFKAASLSKNQFAVNFVRQRRDRIPDAIAKKVLHDILRNWAAHASNEQHVLEYRIAVLSPDIVAPEDRGLSNPIIRMVILRDKVTELLENIRQIRQLPSAELIRSSDGLSLNDVAVRLEDMVRYRLDPFVDRLAAAGLDERRETLRFLSTQLAYDERRLQTQIATAEAARSTLGLYMTVQAQSEAGPSPATTEPTRPRTGDGETIMPQVSDTFIDRLLELTSRSEDSGFRQRLAEEYQKSTLAVVPLQQAVAYDRMLLETIRNAQSASTNLTTEEMSEEMAAIRDDVRQLANKVQELHKVISANLNPSTELLKTGMPITRLQRAVSVSRLVLIGVVVTLAALAISIFLSVLHAHIREEQPDEHPPAMADGPS